MLPDSITVNINTADQAGSVVVKRLTAKSGNPYFTGIVNGLDLAGDLATALGATSASFDGVELRKGEVHITEPSVYSKSNRKAGQVIPGTGGQLTISHSASITVAGEKFTLVVTLIEKPNGIRLRVNTLKQRGGVNTATVQGLSFKAS